nr:hypothetical protein [Klebsiella pneumoniae]
MMTFRDNHINLEHLPPELKQVAIQIGVASENGIYGHSRFCNTDFDDKLALLESIRRLNGILFRALMSSAPDEPPENIRLLNEPFPFYRFQQAGGPLVSSISVFAKPDQNSLNRCISAVMLHKLLSCR